MTPTYEPILETTRVFVIDALDRRLLTPENSRRSMFCDASRFGGISMIQWWLQSRATIYNLHQALLGAIVAEGWLRGVIRLTSLDIARLTGRDALDHGGSTKHGHAILAHHPQFLKSCDISLPAFQPSGAWTIPGETH